MDFLFLSWRLQWVVFPLEYWITHTKIKFAASENRGIKNVSLNLYKIKKSHSFFQRQTAGGRRVQRREKRGGVSPVSYLFPGSCNFFHPFPFTQKPEALGVHPLSINKKESDIHEQGELNFVHNSSFSKQHSLAHTNNKRRWQVVRSLCVWAVCFTLKNKN
jgi:hypothetical protein